MGITISQTYAKIGVETTPGRLEIESSRASLDISREQARISIHNERPIIEIDQYEAFASAGLKNSFDLLLSAKQEAYRNLLDYIGKTAADGDRFAAIEKGGNPIAEIAERDAFPEHEFVMDFIPKTGPRFNVRAWTVEIDPGVINEPGIRNGVRTSFSPGKVNINYTPAAVNLYVAQKASIKINYQASNRIDAYA